MQLSLSKVTPLKFDARVKTDLAPGDPKSMQAVLVRSCVTGDQEVTFGWGPWTLTDSEGSRYPSSGFRWGGMPAPVYPDDESGTWKKGECVKGWILFETVGKMVTTLRYSNSVGETARWRLK